MKFQQLFKRNLTKIINVAKRNPELIQLLEMHNQFRTISQYGDVRIREHSLQFNK